MAGKGGEKVRGKSGRNHVDELRCVKCGLWAKPNGFRIEGVAVRGWKCSCGESYLNPVDANRVLAYNKLKHEVLKSKVSYSGNSLIVRLPAAFAKALGLEKGGPLEIKLDGPNRILIRILPVG